MRHILSTLCLSLSLTLHAQPPSYVPTNGLVGWWPFNGNANDESGNGGNGTVNGPLLVPDRSGVINSAYRFDGIDDDIVTTMQTLNGNAHTVSCWFRSVALLNFTAGLVVWRNTANLSSGLYLYQGDGNYAYDISSCTENNGIACSNCVLDDADWHHYVVVNNGSSTNMYIDGVQVFSFPLSVQQCGNNLLTFGNYGAEELTRFFGDLDDIAIWERALNPNEVLGLFNSTRTTCISPNSVSFSGLASNYMLTDEPVILTGTPSGGVFLGPGVSGSTFDPGAAGLGTHGVVYTFIDYLGCVNSYSQCTDVTLNVGSNDFGTSGGVYVYPNPNRGQFTVELELTGLVGMQVFDARGTMVHNEAFTASGSRTQRMLDLSTLAKGSYALIVEHDGQRVSQTVVVE
jgi:hypothetical protein